MLSEIDPGWGLWVGLALTGAVCFLLARARWNFRAIPRITPQLNPGEPDCMVVIPARNEELIIARAVGSLPHDTVIVVDDHSEDSTTEAARKAGAGVIPAPDLPRGASGKAHACMAGASALKSRWILFADADTCFCDGFLPSAVAAAEANELAFLSLHLDARPQSLRDAFTSALSEAIYYCAIRPRRDPATAFRGQCILVRRGAYEFVGGHGAVLKGIADDSQLAALAARHRLKVGIARAGPLAYALFRDAAKTERRRGYRLILLDHRRAVLSILAVTSMALWPLAAVWAYFDAGWRAIAALVSLPVLFALLWYRNVLALLLPLAVYPVAARTWSGLLTALSGHRIQWKGRNV